VAALAVVPWLGAGTALASPSSDSNCSTVPGGVAATASCAVLGSNGGEVWAARTSANELKVKVFTSAPLGGADLITLCVTKAGPYELGFQCTSAHVSSGTATTINYPLGASFIGASDSVWFAVTVGNSDVSNTALGQGPSVPSPSGSGSPSASPSSTSSSPSPSVSPSETTTPSPSVSPTETTTPTPSVSPTESATSSPSISVLPTKIQGSTEPAVAGLAHTGGNGEMGTALASLALLGVGGALIVGAQARRAPARRH
jgi:hypothetical protein